MDAIEKSLEITQRFMDAGNWWLAPSDLQRQFAEIEALWGAALRDYGFSPYDSEGSIIHTVVNRGNEKYVREAGLEYMLEAYFEGVPLEDIVPLATGGVYKNYYADNGRYHRRVHITSEDDFTGSAEPLAETVLPIPPVTSVDLSPVQQRFSTMLQRDKANRNRNKTILELGGEVWTV